MIKAGIIGATGYAGGELVRLLLQHKEVEINGMVHAAISIRNMQVYTAICSSLWRIHALMIIWKNWQSRWT